MNLKNFYRESDAKEVLGYASENSMPPVREKVRAFKFGRAWFYMRADIDALADKRLANNDQKMELSQQARENSECVSVETAEWVPAKEAVDSGIWPFARQWLYAVSELENSTSKYKHEMKPIKTRSVYGETMFNVEDIAAYLENSNNYEGNDGSERPAN